MKTAYLINCHKNMDHVARLAHRLHSEDSHIFIHVDKKVPQEIYENLSLLISDLEYCYISKTRINAKLGSSEKAYRDLVFYYAKF